MCAGVGSSICCWGRRERTCCERLAIEVEYTKSCKENRDETDATRRSEAGHGSKYDCTPEELAEVYRIARESFTAADLQKYTEPTDDFVSAHEVLREMEKQQAQFDAQRKQS